jgi:hypothetical protein
VYVNLEAAPYICRTDPEHGYVLHTGAPLGVIDEAWLTDDGHLVLRSGDIVAQLDDRDMAQAMTQFVPAGDDALSAWMAGEKVALRLGSVPVQRLRAADMPEQFQFQRTPNP